MRILSRIFFWLGVVGVVGAIIYGFFSPGWETYRQFIAVSANRSAPFNNPLPQLLLAAGVLLVGGFLMGLGIGMFRKKKPGDAKKPSGSKPAANQ